MGTVEQHYTDHAGNPQINRQHWMLLRPGFPLEETQSKTFLPSTVLPVSFKHRLMRQ